MKHTLVKMTTPAGEVVEIAETKVEKMLNRGYAMAKTKSAKTTQPIEVELSHDEIVENEDNL